MTAAPGISVTPRVGLAWSRVSLADFTDRVGSRAHVSLERAESLSGRIGVTMEMPLGESGNGRAFAALDAAREFSPETRTMVEGRMLKASAEPTSVRLRLGGSFALTGRTQLRATAGYRTSGSGNRTLEGGLALTIRF